ncbi:MAG: hypothetical protein JXQ83_02145 [Candidatus Glassbacteria bacterium]|nr:hypothetical protein [Candidatus Glassbacteria bacterium]
MTKAAIPLLAGILGCSGGGDLTSVASSLAETQRLANLTRTTMDGVWKGTLQSVGPEKSQQTIYLVFAQSGDITLVQSLLILEDIEVDGSVSQDTFLVRNGIFDNYRVRFNISPWPSGSLVAEDGHPVLFEGELSENIFISGEFSAGSRTIAIWEAELFSQSQAAP